MTRKYLNDRWCVRCNRLGPTPYLKTHWKKLVPEDKDSCIVDIGCGNGRNATFLKGQGYKNVKAFDMANDYGVKLVLGAEPFPIPDKSADVILANYVFMFLDKKERSQAIREIKRVAKPGCTIMVELYPAKDSHAKSEAATAKLQKQLLKALGWDALRFSKNRFIAKHSCGD